MPLSSGWWERNPELGLHFIQSSTGMAEKKAVLIKHHNCIFEGPSIIACLWVGPQRKLNNESSVTASLGISSSGWLPVFLTVLFTPEAEAQSQALTDCLHHS